MLGNVNVHVILAVKDIERAKNFYENTLGLRKVKEEPYGVTYQSGNSQLFVYESEYAGTNQANAASWETEDVEGAVEELKGKGVTFEQYDIPDTTRQGDIHIMGPKKAAWFKDPDGNILCVSNSD